MCLPVIYEYVFSLSAWIGILHTLHGFDSNKSVLVIDEILRFTLFQSGYLTFICVQSKHCLMFFFFYLTLIRNSEKINGKKLRDKKKKKIRVLKVEYYKFV